MPLEPSWPPIRIQATSTMGHSTLAMAATRSMRPGHPLPSEDLRPCSRLHFVSFPASRLDAREQSDGRRLNRRCNSISSIRPACIEVQRSSCVIVISTAQSTFGVLLVPKKYPALVNVQTVVSVRKVAGSCGTDDVWTKHHWCAGAWIQLGGVQRVRREWCFLHPSRRRQIFVDGRHRKLDGPLDFLG